MTHVCLISPPKNIRYNNDQTGTEETQEEFDDFIPGLKPVFFKLQLTDEQTLISKGHHIGWVLRLLQQRLTDTKAFEPKLSQTLGELEKMARHERERWLELITFIHAMIHDERGPREHERFSQTILDSVKANQDGRTRCPIRTIMKGTHPPCSFG